MKAEELRIGNLLYFKGSELVAKVQLINAPKHFDCRDEYGSFIPNGDYEPIPLTEEWLLKFGFLQDGILFTSPKDLKEQSAKDTGIVAPSFFFNDRLGKWMDCQTRICVEYVHQLQNLYFALTGTELTLNQ